jgi:acetyl esterase/lipase
MSLQSIMFNLGASKADKKRDSAIPLPEGVTEYRNISYGCHGTWNLLDVYVPAGTADPLPTIISIHGGGYVYGSKEIYRRYGMDMAKRGFAFVNFNYRLAPKWKFPAPLHDTNAVLNWVCANARRYHLDPSRIILLGDSAGAQLTSQYAAMHTNHKYAALFQMQLAPVTIRAVGLFCGMYDMAQRGAAERKGLALDYLGKHIAPDDPRFAVLENITASYPPAFIATACHDFLRPCAEPMFDFLRGKGVDALFRCYGTEEQKEIAHVFHVNIPLPEARQCNDDAALFFAKYV